MSAVPMAIFYADKLDDLPNDGNLLLIANAADELRRLHESNRDLLEALQYAVKQVPELATVPGIAAAITKATGATT